MPNIKPVSDLRNYSDALHDVTALDMQDFEKMQATLRVMNELAKGRKSGEEKGIMAVSEEERSAQFYKDPLWNSRTDYEYSGKIRT